MKKPKTIADLLAVADVYIEASEARAWLLDSCNKGLVKKQQQEDREVNVVDHGNRMQQPADQKEKRSFRCPTNAEKWCEIHRITGMI
jgi:6-phosphogluconate dehydrogenase (decarboxylating)